MPYFQISATKNFTLKLSKLYRAHYEGTGGHNMQVLAQKSEYPRIDLIILEELACSQTRPFNKSIRPLCIKSFLLDPILHAVYVQKIHIDGHQYILLWYL